jgi:hypothetical protein
MRNRICANCGAHYRKPMSTAAAVAAILVGIAFLLFGGCGLLAGLFANAGLLALIGLPLVLGGIALFAFAIESLRAPRTRMGFPVLPPQTEKPDMQDSRPDE